MKKLLLLTKTLLVATVLLMGGANSAWAVDYKAVWQQTFDGDDYATGWSITPSQVLVSGSDYAIIFGTGNNSSSGSISYANNTNFSQATNYSFEFDYGVRATHSNGGTNTVTINANNTETKLLSISTEKGSTTTTVYNAAGTSVGTFSNETYTNPKSLPSSDKIYHFKITADATNGVYLVVTNSASATVIASTRIANFGQITGISVAMGRYWATVAFNNFVLSYDIDPYKTRASAAVSAYTAVKDKVMNSTVKSTLDGAKSALDAFGDDAAIAANISGYISAISALETANGNAETSADNFVILNELIGNSKPAGYVAPSGAETKYTSNADVDPVALASAVRAAIITAGTASENTDISGLIINNSFELGTTYGWTTTASDDTGARNNNDPYTTSGIDGSYQFNTWSKGTPITQTIGTLPEGKYKLACKVASDADNVIYLTVNESHNAGTTATGKGTYLDAEYIFSLGESTEVTIGAVGGNADGSYIAEGGKWYKADKFTITYLGEDPLEVAKKALNDEIDAATDVKNAWTPKVGTAPFKYNSTYYDALVTELGEANAVKTGGSDDPDDYTTAKTELEGAKDAIASSVLNEPASDKYYRLYLAEGGVSTGKNLNMLKIGAGNAVITEAPYPVKFVKSGDNYIIKNPYNYYVATNRTNNSNWGTFIDLAESDAGTIDEGLKPTTMYVNANEWGIEPQEDGTFKMLNQQATWKGWGWYLGTWSSSEGAKVAAYDGSASPKNPTKTTWLCSEPIEITDVNLAVNATTGWGTFIAPYDNLTPSTVKAYTVSHKDGNIVYFEENETGVLSANTPYILSTEESSNVAVAFKGIANNDEETYSANGLVGLLTASTVPANSYILQYQAGKVGTAFYKLASNMTGTAYRCYLDLALVPTEQNARATVRMTVFGGITGVANVEAAAEAKVQDGKFFKDGKLFIMKNGVKYNAAGAQVK